MAQVIRNMCNGGKWIAYLFPGFYGIYGSRILWKKNALFVKEPHCTRSAIWNRSLYFNSYVPYHGWLCTVHSTQTISLFQTRERLKKTTIPDPCQAPLPSLPPDGPVHWEVGRRREFHAEPSRVQAGHVPKDASDIQEGSAGEECCGDEGEVSQRYPLW